MTDIPKPVALRAYQVLEAISMSHEATANKLTFKFKGEGDANNALDRLVTAYERLATDAYPALAAEVERLRAVTVALVAFKLWDIERTRDNAVALRQALTAIGLPAVALACSLGRIIDAARAALAKEQP